MFAPGSFELWRSWYEQHPGEIDGFPKKFHSTTQDRREAKAAHCWICTRIQSWGHPDASIDYAFLRRDDFPQHVVQFYSTDGDNEEDFDFRNLNIWRQNIPDDLFNSAAKSRACSHMGQADMLDLASKWLTVCQDSHQCLAEANCDSYPTRLLDVSVNGTVRLVLTAEEHVSGHYATLSHCCGPEKFLVLEPDTISKFTDGFPLEQIPRTFQEVVQVIKHLKIRYLWIDSYCVIQGDSDDAREDWNREAQKMCSVYTNSHLNIGSAYSENPHGGLFQQRDVKNFLAIGFSNGNLRLSKRNRFTAFVLTTKTCCSRGLVLFPRPFMTWSGVPCLRGHGWFKRLFSALGCSLLQRTSLYGSARKA